MTGTTLCLTLKTRREPHIEGDEVWLWKAQVAYRHNGVTMMEGFVRKEWR